MPVYTYRREDGTTFDVRQSFSDSPLTVDPQTGQNVVRVVQAAGIIFKGSGFYVNDSKSASKANIASPGSSKSSSDSAAAKSTDAAPASSETKAAESKPLAAAAD